MCVVVVKGCIVVVRTEDMCLEPMDPFSFVVKIIFPVGDMLECDDAHIVSPLFFDISRERRVCGVCLCSLYFGSESVVCGVFCLTNVNW